MISTYHKYTLVKTLWFFVTAVAIVGVYFGVTEPAVSATTLPGGGTSDALPYMLGLIALVSVGGVVVIGLVAPGRWEAVQDQTDLTLEDTGMLTSGTFTGTVRGRPVRARQVSRKTSSSGGEGSGSSKATFTIVESDLDEPTDMGIFVARAESSIDLEELDGVSIDSTVVGDTFAVTGATSDQFAQDLLTTEAQESLLPIEDLGTVTIGSASETLMKEMPDMSGGVGGFIGDKIEAKIQKQFGDSPSTVAIQTKGVVSDPAELNSQIAAVATVADGFEAALGTTQP